MTEGKIGFHERKGNAYADTWAGFGAGLQGLPESRKSTLSHIDGTAWLIQSRIIACVHEFADKKDYEDKEPVPKRVKIDPLESLGHIPIRDGLRWSCSLCGHTWTMASRARMELLGLCPGPGIWARNATVSLNQTWATRRGCSLVVGGLQVHISHSLKWHRGVIYCNICGMYSAGRVLGKLQQRCNMTVVGNPTAAWRLKRISDGFYPTKKGTWPVNDDVCCPSFITPHLSND